MSSHPQPSPRPALEIFQALVENAFIVVLIVDLDGVIRYISPSLRFVLGYHAEEREGQSALEFIAPEDRDKAREQLAEVAAKPGARGYMQLKLRHKDGSWRSVEAMARNLCDDPAVRGIVVNYRDITDRLRAIDALRVSEMRFNKAFSASPDAITINYIGSGRFLDVNPAFETLTGYAHNEVIGLPPSTSACGNTPPSARKSSRP